MPDQANVHVELMACKVLADDIEKKLARLEQLLDALEITLELGAEEDSADGR